MDKTLLILYLVALGGSALYLVYVAFRQRRALKEDRDVYLTTRYEVSPDVALALGLFFLLIPAPFFYMERDKIPSVFFKNPPTFFFLLFSLVGIGLVSFAVYKFLKVRGVSRELHISEIDLSPRGVLSGVVRFRGKEIKREGLKVRLILQRAYVAHKRELRIGEVPLWSQEIESVPYSMGNALEVPFKFELGDDFPPIEDWEEGYELLLLLESDKLGVEVFLIKSKGAPTEDITLEEVFREPITPGAKSVGEVLAERSYSNQWYSILSSSFVALFPLFMWFLLRGERVFEVGSLERFLFGGIVGIATFFLPLYMLAKRLKEGRAEEKKEAVRGIMRMVKVFIIVALTGWGYVAYKFFVEEGASFGKLFKLAELYFLDGLLGMFFLLGVYALLMSLREFFVREGASP